MFNICIVKQPQFQIGIKNNVTADAGEGICEVHFLETIQDKEYFDWDSMTYKCESLLESVMSQINAIKPKKILQKIDSWGGDADAGKGVYNFLKDYPAKVETKIINKAASAATVIACAGSKITMPATGFYVIHQASNAAIGTAKDLREAADVADRYTEAYCEIYAQNNRKGKTKEEIKALIADGDYWMTGTQAKEMGFVDDTYNDESTTVTACISDAKQLYENIPQHILDLQANAIEPTEDKSIKEHVMELKNLVTAAMAKLKGSVVSAKSENISADIAEMLAHPLTDLAEEMQGQVTAALNEQKESITASVTADVETKVTAALDAKYGEIITSLQKNVTDLTADLEKQAGKATAAADKGAAASNGRTLTGKFANEQ